jgi:hypothetical protein
MPLSIQQLRDKIDAKIYNNPDTKVRGDVMNEILDDILDIITITETQAVTGTAIKFDGPKIYNTYAAPATANLTNDLTDARVGVVQKVYFQPSVAPTFPANWKLIGEGYIILNAVNILMVEYCDANRIEYSVIFQQNI